MIAIAVMISAGGVAGLEIEKFFAHMSYIELLQHTATYFLRNGMLNVGAAVEPSKASHLARVGLTGHATLPHTNRRSELAILYNWES